VFFLFDVDSCDDPEWSKIKTQAVASKCGITAASLNHNDIYVRTRAERYQMLCLSWHPGSSHRIDEIPRHPASSVISVLDASGVVLLYQYLYYREMGGRSQALWNLLVDSKFVLETMSCMASKLCAPFTDASMLDIGTSEFTMQSPQIANCITETVEEVSHARILRDDTWYKRIQQRFSNLEAAQPKTNVITIVNTDKQTFHSDTDNRIFSEHSALGSGTLRTGSVGDGCWNSLKGLYVDSKCVCVCLCIYVLCKINKKCEVCVEKCNHDHNHDYNHDQKQLFCVCVCLCLEMQS